MKPWFGASLVIGVGLWLAGCVSAPVSPKATSLSLPVELAYLRSGQVWLYDAETETHQPIAAATASTGTATASAPALLADGTAVLFVQAIGAETTQPYYELWEYTVATQSSRLLATHQTSPTQLRLAPNGRFVTYLVGDVLYLTELSTAISTRLHEGAIASAWSPNSRRIAYSTSDDRILTREFDVASQLSEPKTLLEQAAAALAFSSNHSLVFVGEYNNDYAVVEYQLNDGAIAPITSLRFTTPATGELQLAASGKYLLYSRGADATDDPTVWLLDLPTDLSKPLLTAAGGAVWSNSEDTIYYQTLEPQAVQQTTISGLHSSVFVAGGSNLTSPSTLGSNDIIP